MDRGFDPSDQLLQDAYETTIDIYSFHTTKSERSWEVLCILKGFELTRCNGMAKPLHVVSSRTKQDSEHIYFAHLLARAKSQHL